MLNEEKKTIDYLLSKLIEKGGQTNFYTLHTKEYKNIVETQNQLETLGYIKGVPKSLGIAYAITTEGKKLYYDRTEVNVLKWLKNNEGFHKTEDVFKALNVPVDIDGDLPELIEARLIKGDKVFSTDDSGICISEGGLDYLRQVKFGFMADFEEQKSNSKETINEQERQEIISKIDKVLSRFDKADIQQQVLFEEMEELKEYIGTMSKKTWAQLLKGKLLDLTVGGIVSKSNAVYVFNTIAESLKAGFFTLHQ